MNTAGDPRLIYIPTTRSFGAPVDLRTCFHPSNLPVDDQLTGCALAALGVTLFSPGIESPPPAPSAGGR